MFFSPKTTLLLALVLLHFSPVHGSQWIRPIFNYFFGVTDTTFSAIATINTAQGGVRVGYSAALSDAELDAMLDSDFFDCEDTHSDQSTVNNSELTVQDLPGEILYLFPFDKYGVTKGVDEHLVRPKLSDPVVLFDFLLRDMHGGKFDFVFKFLAGRYEADISGDEQRDLVREFLGDMVRCGRIPEHVARSINDPTFLKFAPFNIHLIVNTKQPTAGVLRILFGHLFKVGSFAQTYDWDMYEAVLRCFVGKNVYEFYDSMASDFCNGKTTLLQLFESDAYASVPERLFKEWMLEFFSNRNYNLEDPKSRLHLVTNHSVIDTVCSWTDFDAGLAELIKYCIAFQSSGDTKTEAIKKDLLQTASTLSKKLGIDLDDVIKVFEGNVSIMNKLHAEKANLLWFVKDKTVLRNHFEILSKALYSTLPIDDKIDFFLATKNVKYESDGRQIALIHVRLCELVVTPEVIQDDRVKSLKEVCRRLISHAFFGLPTRYRPMTRMLIKYFDGLNDEKWNRLIERFSFFFDSLEVWAASSKDLEHASHVPRCLVQRSHALARLPFNYRLFEELANQLNFFMVGKADQEKAIDQFFKEYEKHGWDITKGRDRIMTALYGCYEFVMARLISLYNPELDSLLPDVDVKVTSFFYGNSYTFRVPRKARVVDLYMFMHVLKCMGGFFDYDEKVLLFFPNTLILAPLASSVEEVPELLFRFFELADINPMIDAFQKDQTN